jgi:hypothetical protein
LADLKAFIDLSSPTLAQPTAPRASIATIASDAPDKDRIEPPTGENFPSVKPGQYIEGKNRTSRTVYY